MPELPEVEVTRQGLLPVTDATIQSVTVRHHGLRWPVPADLPTQLQGQRVLQLTRRAKYILMQVGQAQVQGTVLLHLGMSGRLCLLDRFYPPEKHDHIDIAFVDGRVVRLRDPRRFGAVLWLPGDAEQAMQHVLLATLGPEPLLPAFNADYLYQMLRSRAAPIKTAIMDAHLVVGVGNIYASESLFRARIHPQTQANQLSKAQCARLVDEIKATLQAALAAGGSSLRDFFGADGNPGYFQQTYFVYGRAGEPCHACGQPILNIRLGQRSTFFCAHCQKKPR